ncbi:MAG: hypothetical protein ACLP01_05450 [Solirubrobacteraceae bacterium]
MAHTKSKNGQTSLRDWSFAIAAGASSAFDITGTRMLDSNLLGADSRGALDPPGRVATDVARVMRSFGRSAECAVQALAIGDDSENGTTSARPADVSVGERPRESD